MHREGGGSRVRIQQVRGDARNVDSVRWAGEVENCTRTSSERARRCPVYDTAPYIAFCGKLRCAS